MCSYRRIARALSTCTSSRRALDSVPSRLVEVRPHHVLGRIQQRRAHAVPARLRLRGQGVHPRQLAVLAEKQHGGAEEMIVAGAGDQDLRGITVQMAAILRATEAVAVECALLEQHQLVEVGVFATAHVHAVVLRRDLRGALRLPARNVTSRDAGEGGNGRHPRILAVCARDAMALWWSLALPARQAARCAGSREWRLCLLQRLTLYRVRRVPNCAP